MSLMKSSVCPFERQQIGCKICDGTSGAMGSIFCAASDARLLDKIFKCTRVRVVPVCGIVSPVCEFCQDRINQFDESFKPVLSEYVVEKVSRSVAPDDDPFGCLDPLEEGEDVKEEEEEEEDGEVRDVQVPAILEEVGGSESVEVAKIKKELRDLLEFDVDQEEEDDHWDDEQDENQEEGRKVEKKPKPKREAIPKRLTKCDICGKEVAYMKDHMRIHKEEKKFKCPKCDRSFSQSSNLIYHVRKHTGEKPFVCTYENCDKAFICKAHLISHERFHVNDKPYQCEICSKRFNQACNLNKHRRVHTGAKPYSCTICGRSFMNLSNMKTHEKRHRGERNFCCQLCPKRFYDNNHLERHLRVHSKPAKISCTVCSKKFSSERAAKSHELQHAQSLTCKICPAATFESARSLKIHQKTHHRPLDKTIPCADCSKSFSQQHQLERHIRRMHGKKYELVSEPDLAVSEEVEIITGDYDGVGENLHNGHGAERKSPYCKPELPS